MYRSNNVAARIFERQISTPAPGTSVHRARRFYENIVPSQTIFDVECPDILFRKFSDDGRYLITFSRNHQDLIVYRTTWLTFSCRDGDCRHDHDLPSKAKKFESFFTKLYCVALASAGELICKDFFLYAENNRFGLFATSTAQIQDAPVVGGAIPGIPSIDKITFHLVRMEDGVILDERVFCNDYINLAHSMGVYLYDDLVAIVSLRYQRIHVLQIRDSGNLVELRTIGEYGREDDELFLNSSAQCAAIPDRIRTSNIGSDLDRSQQYPEAPFLSGLKQRLLSFIFQGLWHEEEDPILRMHCLKKKFFFHFQDYADLVIWKVQFLDRHHLLIKFGSADGGVARNTDNHPAFFAVYNMETTDIISFYQSSADELYTLFELFCDHFHSSSKNSFYMNFLSSHSNNIHARDQLRSNKIKSSSLPQVHRARRFYENIVPSQTIFDVECPDILFRKFSDDGRYLITFSRNHQDLIVYRTTWLTFSCRDEDCRHDHDLPSKAKKFESFFTKLYCVALASAGELICKDFFLYAENNRFGLFATSTAQIQDAPVVGGAIPGIPSIDKITFHLVRMEDGVILDERVFCNDYINLAHSMGVYLYDDLVAIVSLRYQRIHVLQIRDSGNLVELRTIGEYGREDDELFLNSSAQCAAIPDRIRMSNIVSDLDRSQQYPEAPFLGGLKQRLLSFIFRGLWHEEEDPILRMHCLKKKFFFHFQDYADLVIWKVQFLDRHHLLIKFGSADGGVARNTDNHPAFFAVYNMETTDIISFYQSSADELYTLFELFCDHFHSSSKNSFYMNFLSSHSNNIHARDQLRSNKIKSSSLPQVQFVKKMLSTLPINCQSQSPSAYFDHSLFRYDEKLISATDRHRQSTDHPIKFISRRQPNTLKFKIKSGPESGSTDTRTKKISSFIFHPTLPLAISVQQTLFLQQAVVNIHYRR